jgi:hypothetical protein
MVLPAVFPDDIEVQVRDELEDARLVAAIELVSPSNKDRPEERRAFAAKCAAYLATGVGLVVADVVTTRQANMHDELVRVMGWDESYRSPADTWLCAAAYRPARRQEVNQIDAWLNPLTIGGELPKLPLALRGAGWVPIDLDATYTEARRRSRL